MTEATEPPFGPRSGRKGVIAALLSLVLSTPVLAQAYDWNTVTNAAPGRAEVIGTYTAGCVRGAVSLPTEGPGYEAVRISRNRHWGHPAAIAFTRDLTARFQKLGLPHVYIGDISQPRGGPAFPLHASHQAGLDVDIWFDLTARPKLTASQRENLPVRSLVLAGDGGIDAGSWKAGHMQMLRTAAERPQVDRIFVNKWIKRHLCETERDRSWLHKVTSWYGHDEHFHIRLSCPADSPLCVPQAAVPAGDGCGESLDWWFRPAAPPTPRPPGPPPRPRLPPQCDAVLRAP